ncbi:enoyl-CoA hydratase/isomerase family protein [Zavarzinia sp. CC-PAN008]|uniref:enoyl-CoA hydratase/isomerase family protein n=1 Tax=Zavarzinia sp. CC-PAN008 TaxID=3243332 RepID=UPI003F7470B0
MGFNAITYAVADGIARLTFNRPDRRNAITGEMMTELGRALDQAVLDRSIRVLVLTGAGRDFCPGADIHHYADGGTAEDRGYQDIHDFRVTRLLHEAPFVTVAAVNGACAGAGFGWALACDLRIAGRAARFNSAFLDVGVAGDMAGPWFLQRLLGSAKARELYFLPQKFDGEEAARIGLVNRVVDDAALAGEVDAIATRLARAAPLALRAMKANFLLAEKLDLASYIEVESERHRGLFASADTKEAFAAYAGKRAPRFEGR